MTTDIQGVRPETTRTTRSSADDGAFREPAAAPESRTGAPTENRRRSEEPTSFGGGVPEDLVSRFEQVLAGTQPDAVPNPALLALQAAAARLASLTDLVLPDTLKGVQGTQTSDAIQSLVDLLAAAMAANGQVLPQVSVTLTLPMPKALPGPVGSLDDKPRTVIVRMRPEPDGSGVTLTLQPVGIGTATGTPPGGLGLAARTDLAGVADDSSLEALLAGTFMRGPGASRRSDATPGLALGGPLAPDLDAGLSIRLPTPTAIQAPTTGAAHADLKPVTVDRVLSVHQGVLTGAVDKRMYLQESTESGQVLQLAPVATAAPTGIAAAPTGTAIPEPAGAAQAVWDQVRAMSERMAAGVGSAGVHQIRLEIDPRLLPGVQVAIQMAAGQIQVEFFCANEASRRRLRAAAIRDVDQMADRLGRAVHVTLHANGPDDAHASAEHLHAGR